MSLSIGLELPFLIFVLAVLVSARYGGFWAGMAATGLSLLFAILFLTASGHLTDMDTADLMRMGLFLVEGYIISALNDKIRSSGRDSEKSAQEAAGDRQTLHQSEQRYLLLVENVRDYAIFIINEEGHILDCGLGVEHIFGYPVAEIIDKPFAIIFIPEDVREDAPAQLLRRTLAEGREESERWHLRKDGSRFQASSVTTAIRDASGNLRGFTMITRDITERVEMEAALRRSEVMSALGRLVSSVAHEVRNPLFAISSALDAFEARFGEHIEYGRYTTRLRTELNRMNALMEELLAYAQPYRQEFLEGSVAKILEECVSSCRPLADASQVRIECRISEGLPTLPLNERRLPLVFTNLLKNAISFSPPRSTVVVCVSEGAGADQTRWIDCSVEDSGPGLKEEDIPLIFEPFFTRRRGGTGLGLAIVQRIVEEHGGHIFAQNRPEGGTCMTVRIPLAVAPSMSEEFAHAEK